MPSVQRRARCALGAASRSQLIVAACERARAARRIGCEERQVFDHVVTAFSAARMAIVASSSALRERRAGAAEALPHRFRRDAADHGRFAGFHAFDRDEQQGLAIRGRQRASAASMRRPVSLATVDSNGDGRGVPSGHSPISVRRVRVFDQPRSAVADVQVARDREQERTEPRVGLELVRAIDEAQPGFFEQIFGDVAAARSRARKLNSRALNSA